MAIDIRREYRKFIPHLLKAQEENLNEADTCQRLVKFFETVLGYDAMTEITREKQIKGKYVDFAIKIDGVIRLLIEAKAAGVVLRDRHIDQAERYAAEGNIRWVLLTNGVTWILYHLTFDEGIEYERAFEVDIAKDPDEQAPKLLGLLHKIAIKADELEKYWGRRIALSAGSIGKAIMNEGVLSNIRREIRRQEGILIDIEDLARSIHGLFSPEAREQMGPIRIRKARRIARPGAAAAESSFSECAAESVPAEA